MNNFIELCIDQEKVLEQQASAFSIYQNKDKKLEKVIQESSSVYKLDFIDSRVGVCHTSIQYSSFRTVSCNLYSVIGVNIYSFLNYISFYGYIGGSFNTIVPRTIVGSENNSISTLFVQKNKFYSSRENFLSTSLSAVFINSIVLECLLLIPIDKVQNTIIDLLFGIRLFNFGFISASLYVIKQPEIDYSCVNGSNINTVRRCIQNEKMKRNCICLCLNPINIIKLLISESHTSLAIKGYKKKQHLVQFVNRYE